MRMLRCLDRCHMAHDEKWALFIKHSADKAEFRSACHSQQMCDCLRGLGNAMRSNAFVIDYQSLQDEELRIS